MQIQVKCSCRAETCPEWAMVELQGVVEVQPAFHDRLHDLVIGHLCRPSSLVGAIDEVYTLTVGYHELTGTKVTLKNPLVVLKKVTYMDVDKPDQSPPKVELDVVGIIRHKILFKTRPKALISGSTN